MKTPSILAGLLLAVGATALAAGPGASPSPDPWADLRFLLGSWKGDNGGDPGAGSGAYTFREELGGEVLVRHNAVTFPARPGKPGFTHDDLLVVYREEDARRAIYFDSEGHVIRYRVEASPGTVTFESEGAADAPRQRLSYRQTGKETVEIVFAVGGPGQEPRPHVSGAAHRVGP